MKAHIFRGLLAAGMVTMGTLHFAHPEPFIQVVPSYLPYHSALVAISGAAEIAGGLGLLLNQTRRAAGIGLILLFIAVFPANIDMAIHRPAMIAPQLQPLLWIRLPFQPLLIWWAYSVSNLRSGSSARAG